MKRFLANYLTSLSVLIWLVLSHEPDGEPDHVEGAHRVHHLHLMGRRIVPLVRDQFFVANLGN
jgi:hypothetical protein